MALRHYSDSDLDLGSQLRRILKESGIGRQALAAGLQCSLDAVDNWCCGRARITPPHLYDLCSFLTARGVSTAATRQLYAKALEAHGFYPSWPPNPVGGSHLTLCLLDSFSHQRELPILHMISNYLSAENQKTLILDCGSKVDTVLASLELARGIGAVNIVLCGVTMPADIYGLLLDTIDREGCFIILIRTDCPAEMIFAHKNAYAINWSNYDLAYRATRSLAKAGHRRIGTIYVERLANRFSGYLQALKDSGIGSDPALVLNANRLIDYPNITDPNFIRGLRQFILQEEMTALFLPSELLTLVTSLVWLQNDKVPAGLTLCGMIYPGWIGQALNLPISYLSYPINAVAQKAIDILLHRSTATIGSPKSRYVDVTSLAKLAGPRLGARSGQIETITD